MKLTHIHESVDNYMPVNKQFKFGDCTSEVLRVVGQAIKAGYTNFVVVEGMVYLDGIENAIPHTWIELPDGTIKDPTASQFGNSSIEYGPKGEFQERFSATEYPEYHEDSYGIGLNDL